MLFIIVIVTILGKRAFTDFWRFSDASRLLAVRPVCCLPQVAPVYSLDGHPKGVSIVSDPPFGGMIPAAMPGQGQRSRLTLARAGIPWARIIFSCSIAYADIPT
jgi:hypothetical protein